MNRINVRVLWYFEFMIYFQLNDNLYLDLTISILNWYRLCIQYFLHSMPGHCNLTPVWDISILHPLLHLHQCYPTLTNYFFMATTTTTTKVQLNKLPKNTIIFRILDCTIRFNNAKILTHALGSICVCCDGI